MKRSRDNHESTPTESESLDELLKAIEQSTPNTDFDAFCELFRKANSKLAGPIINLIAWQQKYPAEIYVIRTADDHLELCVNRAAILDEHGAKLKTLQHFERCLASVKPKLVVLQSTHKRSNPIKRYGFRDTVKIFGTERSTTDIVKIKPYQYTPSKLDERVLTKAMVRISQW